MVSKNIIISTIYEGFAVKQAIIKLPTDKLILLVDEPTEIKKKEKLDESIKLIKELAKDNFEVEIKKILSYNIPKIIEEVIKIIDRESKEGNKIFIHTSEGRKTGSFALLYASYRRKDKVEGAFYITEEEHNLIKLPMLNFDINETKKEVLKEIDKGNFDIKKLQEKLNIGQSAAYQNLQELKKEGYIENEDELKLTDLGRIMIL